MNLTSDLSHVFSRSLLCCLFLVSFGAFSQGWVPAGSKSMSMANASNTESDAWSYFHNPGAAAAVESFQAGISYENRFLLKELQSQALGLALPLKVGVLTVGGHQYGYRQFRSYKAGVGYAMRLAERFYAGVQLNYQGIQLNENYGSSNELTAELGLLVEVSENWRIGLSVFNLNRARLAAFSDDRYSTYMRLGTSYTFSDRFKVSAEVEKDLENKPKVRIGAEYKVVKELLLRGGFATSRPEFTFGLGYRFKQVHLGLGSAYDQILGWSPNFSLEYVLGKKD